MPTHPFEEISPINVSFREMGFVTGSGSEQLMLEMLKDKAANLGADAVAQVRIQSEKMPAPEWNLIWSASARAIRYTEAPRNVAPAPQIVDEVRVNTGTGFFITPNGYLVTAFHVIGGSLTIELMDQGETYGATVVAQDAVNDLAILKADTAKTFLFISPSRDLELGTELMTLGFPNIEMQGLNPKLTLGNLSGLSGLNDDPRHFQISVALQPGNSGGALVTKNGGVVGVITSRLGDIATLERSGSLPQNVNYAIKSDYLIALMSTVQDLRLPTESGRDKPLSESQVIQRLEAASILVIAR